MKIYLTTLLLFLLCQTSKAENSKYDKYFNHPENTNCVFEITTARQKYSPLEDVFLAFTIENKGDVPVTYVSNNRFAYDKMNLMVQYKNGKDVPFTAKRIKDDPSYRPSPILRGPRIPPTIIKKGEKEHFVCLLNLTHDLTADSVYTISATVRISTGSGSNQVANIVKAPPIDIRILPPYSKELADKFKKIKKESLKWDKNYVSENVDHPAANNVYGTVFKKRGFKQKGYIRWLEKDRIYKLIIESKNKNRSGYIQMDIPAGEVVCIEIDEKQPPPPPALGK